MTRDQVLIKDKNLKSKLYRTNDLTLGKLLDIVSQYHHKEALILLPDEQINTQLKQAGQVNSSLKFHEKFYNCKIGHMERNCCTSLDHIGETCGKVGHFAVCCQHYQD